MLIVNVSSQKRPTAGEDYVKTYCIHGNGPAATVLFKELVSLFRGLPKQYKILNCTVIHCRRFNYPDSDRLRVSLRTPP